MKCSEHNVAGFRSSNCGRDRRQVSHLTHQNHVRVHSQSASQRLREVGNIDADLSLIDRRFLVLMVVLDRILKRDDVVINCVVEIVDHAGQASRLTATCWACYEKQPSRASQQVADDRR